MSIAIDSFLDLTYHYATEDADEKEKAKFDMRLNLPDERARASGRAVTDDRSPWTKKNEESALSGLVAALSGAG
jgi:hypothetical protein